MKKKGFIITLVCTMLITAAAGIIVSAVLRKDGAKNLPSLMGGTSSSVSAPTVSGESASSADSVLTQTSSAASASTGSGAAENVESRDGSDVLAAESRDGSDASITESRDGSDVSGEESRNGSDVSGTESTEESGLSKETKRYDPTLLLADGRPAYEYTTAPEGSVIEYADFSTEDFVNVVAAVYQMAHDNNFQYGNSDTLPPCEDGLISCDRLIARALWDLGITDQPQGGVKMHMDGMDEVYWFTRHGFITVNDPSLLQRGDILYMQLYDENGQPQEVWDNFVLSAYDPETQMCEKYDCGHFTPTGEDRISSEQPFRTVLAEYGDARRFVCGFRLRERPEEEPAPVG